MGQKLTIEYFDDLDGSELGDNGETVEFALDGRTYTIDLNQKNAEKLRDKLAPYIEAGTRVTAKSSGRKSGAASRKTAGDTKAIREWARSAGYDISDRGRIPAEIAEAYAAAK